MRRKPYLVMSESWVLGGRYGRSQRLQYDPATQYLLRPWRSETLDGIVLLFNTRYSHRWWVYLPIEDDAK